MFEFDPSYLTWGIDVQQRIQQLHSKGVRTTTPTSKVFPSVESQQALFDSGFDVVYTYDTQNAVIARTNVDKARGVIPPVYSVVQRSSD